MQNEDKNQIPASLTSVKQPIGFTQKKTYLTTPSDIKRYYIRLKGYRAQK